MQGHDNFPEPKIVIAALEACARLKEHSVAVRYLEALKYKAVWKQKGKVMSDKLDQSLESIIAGQKKGGRGGRGGRGGSGRGGLARGGSGRIGGGGGSGRGAGRGAGRGGNFRSVTRVNNANSDAMDEGFVQVQTRPAISRVGGGGRINRNRTRGGQNSASGTITRTIVNDRTRQNNAGGNSTHAAGQWTHDLFEREEMRKQVY